MSNISNMPPFHFRNLPSRNPDANGGPQHSAQFPPPQSQNNRLQLTMPTDSSESHAMMMAGFVRSSHGWYRNPHPQQDVSVPQYNPYRAHNHYSVPAPVTATHMSQRSLNGASHSASAGHSRRMESNESISHGFQRSTIFRQPPTAESFYPNEQRLSSVPASVPNDITAPRFLSASSHPLFIRVENGGNVTPRSSLPSPQALRNITNQASEESGSDPQDRFKPAFSYLNESSNLNDVAMSQEGAFIPQDDALKVANILRTTMSQAVYIPQGDVLNANLKRSADDANSESSSSSNSPATVPSVASDAEKYIKRPRSTSSGSSTQESITATSNQGPRGMLDLLCEATTIVTKRMEEHDAVAPGPILKLMNMDQPETATKKSGKSCNCPRSRCIKLYCECFQSGKYCSAECCCKKCKNNAVNDGPNGPRTRALQNILSRNPYAFHKDKHALEQKNNAAVGVNCRCVKSQCLKLYCDCFQSGKVCGEYCMCVNCLNTDEESGDHGRRTTAQSLCLMRKPDAFDKKVKKVGSGCSCKNSRCLKKYCDCFNAGLACSSAKCSCRECENLAPEALKAHRAQKKSMFAAAFKNTV